MSVYSAVEESLDLWCLVLTAEARITDLSACMRTCLETPGRYAHVDALVDARQATGLMVASDAEMDELVRLVRRLRGERHYQAAYLTRTAEMRTNVDVFLQTIESGRSRRKAFAGVAEAVRWLGRGGAEQRVARFLAEMQRPRRGLSPRCRRSAR